MKNMMLHFLRLFSKKLEIEKEKEKEKKKNLYFISGFWSETGVLLVGLKLSFSVGRLLRFGDEFDDCNGIIVPHKWRVERGILDSWILWFIDEWWKLLIWVGKLKTLFEFFSFNWLLSSSYKTLSVGVVVGVVVVVVAVLGDGSDLYDLWVANDVDEEWWCGGAPTLWFLPNGECPLLTITDLRWCCRRDDDDISLDISSFCTPPSYRIQQGKRRCQDLYAVTGCSVNGKKKANALS